MSDHDPAAVARTLTEWQRFFAGFGVLGGYINRSEYASISALCQQAATALTAFAALCGPDGTPPVSRATTDAVVELLGEIKGAVANYDVVRRILKLLEVEVMAKRKPDEVTVKQLKDGTETLWLNDAVGPERWAVIEHRPTQDSVTFTVADEESTPKQRFIFIRRALVKKILPYLTKFADGGDFGITGETTI